jgi:uncharacterized protein (DUF58 family)
MRHARLVVREFETDTDRVLWLVVDATPSMAYGSPVAPGAKFAYAAVLAAALTRIAVAGGDCVALDWLGGRGGRPVVPTAGKGAFERVVQALEWGQTGNAFDTAEALEGRLARIARRAGRGSMVVVLSDLIDLPEGALDSISALGMAGRTLVVTQVLDPYEAGFPFQGTARFRSSEGGYEVEVDATAGRSEYLRRLQALQSKWREGLAHRGGRFVEATTQDDAVDVVRDILRAAARGSW